MKLFAEEILMEFIFMTQNCVLQRKFFPDFAKVFENHKNKLFISQKFINQYYFLSGNVKKKN